MLNSAASMMFALCRHIRDMGKLRRIKRPESESAPIKVDLRNPSVFFFAYPHQTASIVSVCFFPILLICALRNVAEIAKSIVRTQAVYVVNLPIGPMSNYIQKHQPMGCELFAVNSNDSIAEFRNSSDFVPSIAIPVIAGCTPKKRAGFIVVVEKLAQTLRGKIGLSHDAPRKRIGQRPACVSSTCGLRYFNAWGPK